MFSNLNTKTSGIKNIVFDFAGVIVTCPYNDFVKKTFPELRSWDQINMLSDLIFKSDIWSNYDKGLQYDELNTQLCDLINSKSNVVKCNKKHIDNLIDAIKELMVPMEETVALIKELKISGMKIFGLTNMPKEIFDHLITTYEFFKDFSGVTASAYAGLAKPDKPIYERLIKDNNIIANETIFLDDRSINLVKANEIGMTTILFDNIHNVCSELNKKLNNSQRNMEIEADICNKLDQLKVTMFGRRIHNPTPLQSKRTSYDIHPYSKQGTGVSCTITFTDEKTKIPYILLSKKKNKNQYDQIGGYTRGQGPEGSEISYDKRSEDERDANEEVMIGNIDAIQINQNKTEQFNQTTYSLKQLKDSSTKGFIAQQTMKLGKKINPLQMKKSLNEQGIIYCDDYNAWDTALRETKEETGLELSQYKPKELYTSDDFGISNEDERLHTKTTHYLFHLGTLKESPLLKAGSDIDLLKWIPVTDIELQNGKVKDDLSIRKSYILQTLPRAIKKIRELELEIATNNTFSKYKNLGAYTFSDPFSFSACQYHQIILDKARKITSYIKIQLAKDEPILANQ